MGLPKTSAPRLMATLILRCVAVPVCDHSGRVMAALALAGRASRLSEGRLPRLAEQVTTAAETLSRNLGRVRQVAVLARG